MQQKISKKYNLPRKSFIYTSFVFLVSFLISIPLVVFSYYLSKNEVDNFKANFDNYSITVYFTLAWCFLIIMISMIALFKSVSVAYRKIKKTQIK